MGRYSPVSDKMRSLTLCLFAVLFLVSVEANPKVNGKPFRSIRKKIIGNIKNKFKVFLNKEDGAEILNAVNEDTSEASLPKPMTTPATSEAFSEIFGYNIAERVTMDWGAMEQSLLAMQMNEYTRSLVQELVDANPCVNSLLAYNSMMKDLDQILPLFSYFMCQSDPKVSVSSLRETALVLNKMSHIDNVPFLVFTSPIREGLRWS